MALSFGAALILALLVDPLTRFGENERREQTEQQTGFKLLIATFRHMLKKKQILIIPITFWSGIEQGFFGADFTAVSKKHSLTVMSYRDVLFEYHRAVVPFC